MTTMNVYSKEQMDTNMSLKQDTLVSGTNIKTVNGESILGSGNVQAGLTITTYGVESE